MMNPVDALAWWAVVFLCLSLGSELYRQLKPISQEDVAAITLFLANRDQTPLRIRRGVGGPRQHGKHSASRERLYTVLALDADGSRYRHVVAAVDHQADANFALWQRVGRAWSKVIQ
jgi:hypothetical protein